MLPALLIVLLQPGAALLGAAERGEVETGRLLLEEGAVPDSRNELGTTALMLASQARRTEVVRLLLEAGADPNAINDKEMDALGLASFGGHLEVVEVLADGGAGVSRRMQVSGTTPITLAVRRGRIG